MISTCAPDQLAPDETAAVLAHEHAHLRQHHHLITAIATSLTHRLRWVPLLAAASTCFPTTLAILSAAVHVPYALAALTGCL